jgi:predicted nucleic acid-binding Zn ribbon protein
VSSDVPGGSNHGAGRDADDAAEPVVGRGEGSHVPGSAGYRPDDRGPRAGSRPDPALGTEASRRTGAAPARPYRSGDTLWTGPTPGVPSGPGGDLWSAADEPAPRRRRPRSPRDDARDADPARSATPRPEPTMPEPSDAPAPDSPWVEPPFEADGVLPEPTRPAPPEGVPVGEIVELTPPALVAREALNRAKAAARARGYRPGQEPRRRPLDPPRGSAGKDARDPQTVGDTLARLLRDRGWVQDVSVGGVIGRWREVVGDQIADHCQPETFQDGVLTVRTDSTAWATQVRLLVPRLLLRLADDVGEGVVREVRVVGPSGPGFGRGPRSVPGRGPRDTWG